MLLRMKTVATTNDDYLHNIGKSYWSCVRAAGSPVVYDKCPTRGYLTRSVFPLLKTRHFQFHYVYVTKTRLTNNSIPFHGSYSYDDRTFAIHISEACVQRPHLAIWSCWKCELPRWTLLARYFSLSEHQKGGKYHFIWIMSFTRIHSFHLDQIIKCEQVVN